MQKLSVFICILVLLISIPVTIGDYSPLASVVYVDDDYNAGTPGWGVDHFDNIQDGIDAVDDSGTVTVYDGTYNSSLYVGHSVSIIGVSLGAVTIEGNGVDTLITIDADDVFFKNLVIQNGYPGIYLDYSDGFIITRCQFIDNVWDADYGGGMWFDISSDAVIYENNFTNSIVFYSYHDDETCDNNLIYHNNFFSGSLAIDDPPFGGSTNRVNDTYPSGGNYWYENADLIDVLSGPNQDIPGSDGICDNPYFAGRGCEDYYPSVEPFAAFDWPPSLSSPSPVDGATGISITRSTVSIYISDVSGTFDWTIEGRYVHSTGAIGAHNGTKTANLITPLYYFDEVVWYVNASNSLKTVSAIYSFNTLAFTQSTTSYVSQSYGQSDPQWHKTYWDDIQDAIDNTEDGGLVYIYSGTYDLGYARINNLIVNRPMTIQGETPETTIINGIGLLPGTWSPTIYIPEYTATAHDIVIKDLTVTNTNYTSILIGHECPGPVIVSNCIIYCTAPRDQLFGSPSSGIEIYTRSRNVEILQCKIRDCPGDGIFAMGTTQKIIGCNISNCGIALLHAGSGIVITGTGSYPANHTEIRNNVFYRNAWGISIDISNDTKIVENDFIRNSASFGGFGGGISVFGNPPWNDPVRNNTIYHNNFYSNRAQAYDGGSYTNWNDTYPSGGNYWDDFDGASEGAYDRYSGPLQSVPGPDGIVDGNSPNPYNIPGGGGKDNYPLIYPYVGVEIQGIDFTWTPKYPKPKQSVTFTEESSSDIIVKWVWDFGDGSTKESMTAEVTHPYATIGFFTVTLTSQDTHGTVYSTSKRIYVGESPKLFPPKPPKYPDGFTVQEMYMLLRAIDLPKSDVEVTVMVIDSGISSRTYNDIDLGKITAMAHPSFRELKDENGHGTWVNYAIAYILQTKLENSKQISYKVFDADGESSADAFMSAFAKAKELHPDIVSISAGIIGGSPDDPYAKACEDLRNEGIIVIVAAGNFGPTASSIASPGVSDSVITVAASDPQWVDKSNPSLRETKILDLLDDTICPWSSRGPVLGVAMKPDVTSPGESIIGPWLQNERVISGTSMATPLISGGVAVVFANNKGLIDTVKALYFWDKSVVPQAFEDALKASCYEKGDTNSWGTGIVQFDKMNGNLQMGLYSKIIIWFSLPLLLIIIIILLLYYYYRQRSSIYRKKPFKIPKWAKKL